MTAVEVGFPAYEVPAFVAERFPEFRPEDPATWPDPDRCTNGRPWGHDAYSYGYPRSVRDRERLWEVYLQGRARTCRNRWRSEEFRLCGTHLAPFQRLRSDAAKRDRARSREEQHLDLARRLAVHGIDAVARASGVVLQADAVEVILRALDRPFPTTDLTIPPPL